MNAQLKLRFFTQPSNLARVLTRGPVFSRRPALPIDDPIHFRNMPWRASLGFYEAAAESYGGSASVHQALVGARDSTAHLAKRSMNETQVQPQSG